MTASRASFNTLPNEIHTLIIREVFNQDERYRKELGKHYARQQWEDEPYEFIRSKKMQNYGRGVLALYSTCKFMNSLCIPFVFKILPLSKALSTNFHVFIKPRYSLSFTTLQLDCLHRALEGEEDEDEEFFSDESERMDREYEREAEALHEFVHKTLPHLTSISTIDFTFDCTASEIFGRLPDLAASTYSSKDKGKSAIAKHVSRTLSKSITSLNIHSKVYGGFSIPARFTNLTTVVLTIEGADELTKYKIPELEKLTSLSIHVLSTAATRKASLPFSWTNVTWNTQKTLETLELNLPNVNHAVWRFVLKFTASLSFLSLTFRQWKPDIPPTEHKFSQLKSLTLRSQKENIVEVLNRISPPTHAAELKIVLSPSSESESEDHQDLYQALKPFRRRNITLQLELTEEISERVRREFATFTSKSRFAFATLSSPTPWKSWSELVKKPNKDAEPLEGDVKGSDLRSFLECLRDQVDQAERVGDQAALNELARWMAPLAGRQDLLLH